MRPWSVTNCRSRLVFLKSSASTVKSILGLGRGVRISDMEERPRPPRRSGFSGRVLRGISLLDFAMQRMAPQSGVVLSEFELLRLELFIPRGSISGRRLSFLPCLSAFDRDDFAWHKVYS